MKKGLHLIALLVGFLLLMGMGDMGGAPAGMSSTVDKDFSATFTDREDVVTKCTRVNREGRGFIAGKKGRGVVAVPFERIKVAEFVTGKNGVTAVIELVTGSTVEIDVDKNQIFYGSTEFGSYHIEVTNLKKIVFEHK